jgi:formylglycine-generating enzyme required for sulfatase activity
MKGTEAHEVFSREFSRIVSGECGATEKEVALEMLHIFIPLARGLEPDDTGRFLMGVAEDEVDEFEMDSSAVPEHRVRLSPYSLLGRPVLNEEYMLFDPAYRDAARGYEQEVGTGVKAEAHTTWYESWMFATWCGEVELDGTRCQLALPTEAQWEYAHRAGFTSGQHLFDMAREKATLERNLGGLPKKRSSFIKLHARSFEWCFDWCDETYYSECHSIGEITDPQQSDSTGVAGSRVRRGIGSIQAKFFSSPATRWSANTTEQYSFRLSASPIVQDTTIKVS